MYLTLLLPISTGRSPAVQRNIWNSVTSFISLIYLMIFLFIM